MRNPELETLREAIAKIAAMDPSVIERRETGKPTIYPFEDAVRLAKAAEQTARILRGDGPPQRYALRGRPGDWTIYRLAEHTGDRREVAWQGENRGAAMKVLRALGGAV